MRWTAIGPVLATQTASGVIATQSAVLPNLIVPDGVSSPIDLGGAAMADVSQDSVIAGIRILEMR
jgi:hypothetical protein